MTRVVIIGGGFAGIRAAEVLSGRREIHVELIDRKDTFDFRPMLPDVLSGRGDPALLEYPLERVSGEAGFTFTCAAVRAVDLTARKVETDAASVEYDYLLIAAGSETTLPSPAWRASGACVLNDVADARGMRVLLEAGEHETFVIAGGGYTGIEIATNLRARFNRARESKRILVCELGPTPLKSLPKSFQDYTRANLGRMDIEFRPETTGEPVDGGAVRLSPGETIEKGLLIWAVGMHPPQFVRALAAEKDRGGRLKADRTLRIGERCFVAGDAACFVHNGEPLRMSVQFSLSEGALAARNILLDLHGRPLREFHPLDPGYVVPMANNRSCGKVLGVPLKGFLPTLLHYVLCIARSRGLGRRLRMLARLRRMLS